MGQPHFDWSQLWLYISSLMMQKGKLLVPLTCSRHCAKGQCLIAQNFQAKNFFKALTIEVVSLSQVPYNFNN